MPEGSPVANKTGSAADQLRRLLYLLPAASGDEGLALDEAARRLGVDEETVISDLGEVSDREFYHPAGAAEDLRVELDVDRVRVRSGGKFVRPRRLGPREALATHLALRRYSAGLDGEARERVLDVASRVAGSLASVPIDELAASFSVEETGDTAGPSLAPLRQATTSRVRCEIVYLSADRDVPTERSVDPYGILVASGAWYVIGYCSMRKGIRVFRVDRIVGIRLTDDRFEIPDEFDIEEFVRAGSIFRAANTDTARVRYSGRAAQRMEDDERAERQPDGSLLVSHEVAEPDWVVRHVLGFGGEAVLEAPPELRTRVAEAASRISRSIPPAE
jgi:predicted DNA-binding transcriptional regulator YafY